MIVLSTSESSPHASASVVEFSRETEPRGCVCVCVCVCVCRKRERVRKRFNELPLVIVGASGKPVG